MRQKSKHSGFTMIEVLVAVSIVGLFAVLVFFTTTHQISKSRDARRKSDMDRIQVVVEEYEKDFDCYPETLPFCDTNLVDPFRRYINRIPCDPKDKTDYYYYPESGTLCPSWYWLFTRVENEDDKDSVELQCTDGCGPPGEENWTYYVSSPNAPPVSSLIATQLYWGYNGSSCQQITCEIVEGVVACPCQPHYPSLEQCSALNHLCVPQ